MQGACLISTINSINDIDASICTPHMLIINVLTFIALSNGHSWVAIPRNEQEVKIVCNNRVYNTIIKEPCILSMKPGCTAATDTAILDTQSTAGSDSPIKLKLDIIHFNVIALHDDSSKINNASLYSLRSLDQPRIDISDFKLYGRKLDELLNEAETIGNHVRTRTLIETTWFWLTYVGYGLLATLSLYIAYKCKFFKLLTMTTKPCTVIYNNCFNWGGRHKVSQYAENAKSLESIEGIKSGTSIDMRSSATKRKRGIKLPVPLSEVHENSV
ncbi:hypothetical protein KPH14_003659 [Odynerus spinipes]|uniref:Uncharacterized protein n=1 Tax=Odynerus spinipes TaxID=1348599 RepID=A0AAD9RFD7_9HYME|nr:hypothetical protein KPH14_003659 [Odynerus spinipes]